MSSHASRILRKAAEGGLITAATAHAAAQRFDAERSAGGDPDMLAILDGLVAPENRAALAAIDDRSLLGRTIAGFEVEAKLGQGAMGSVFRARQASLGRTVALKVLEPGLALRPEFAERFRREARAVARLEHPHVVQPIDFGADGGLLYFAMEFMAGGSARDRLEARGPLPEADVLAIAMAIAHALEFAEAQGLVHRDIKPDNILFTRFGTIKLADLGLVFERPRDGDAGEAAGAPLTAPGSSMGTPEYMPPEQALGERDLDVRSDLYALGITLFELLAGERPFDGPDGFAVATQHITQPLPRLRSKAPHTSRALVAVIERMTAKKRAARFPSARALREALAAIAADPSPVSPARSDAGALTGAATDASTDAATDAATDAPTGALTEGANDADPAPAAVTLPPLPVTDDVPAPAPLEESALQASEPAVPSTPAGASSPATEPTAGATAGAATSAPQAGPVAATKPAPRASRVGALGLVAAVVAAGLFIAWWLRDPGVDAAAIARATSTLEAQLLERRRPGSGFGEASGDPVDAWVTAQALYALSAHPSPLVTSSVLDEVAAPLLAGGLDGAATGDAPGFAGYPYLSGRDNVACLEATASVGSALALAKPLLTVDPAPRIREVLAYLLARQNPDGSWATIPLLGAEGATTSATVEAVATLIEIGAALGEERRVEPAVARGAGWITGMFVEETASFDLTPRRRSGAHRALPGLDEEACLALLGAQALRRELGLEARPRYRAVLRRFAERGPRADVEGGPGALAVAPMEDYRFWGLPARYRTSASEFAWLVLPWRLLLASRLAATSGMPNRDAWRREARRLRSQLPALASALETEPATWKLAEALYAARAAGFPDAER